MTSSDTQMTRHQMIREMERAGCDIAYYASTTTKEHTLTVYWRGWQTTIIRLGVFDFERAYTEWTEYRDSHVYRVMEHQDQPRSAVRPQELPKVAKRVRSRSGQPTPNVDEALAKTSPSTCARGRRSATLRDRLKQQNAERMAS